MSKQSNSVTLSEAYLQGVESYEGLSLTPYVDVAGYLTIGIGHLIRDNEAHIYLGDMSLKEARSLWNLNRKEFIRRTGKLTLQQAHDLKRHDMAVAISAVESRLNLWGCKDVPDRLKECMVDLAFNVGPGSLDQSIKQKCLAHDWDGVALFMPRFCLAADPNTGRLVPVTGLTFRRYSLVWYYFTGEWWRIKDWHDVDVFLIKLSDILKGRGLKNPLPYLNNLKKNQRY